jgi:hypothetical protein
VVLRVGGLVVAGSEVTGTELIDMYIRAWAHSGIRAGIESW